MLNEIPLRLSNCSHCLSYDRNECKFRERLAKVHITHYKTRERLKSEILTERGNINVFCVALVHP